MLLVNWTRDVLEIRSAATTAAPPDEDEDDELEDVALDELLPDKDAASYPLQYVSL